MNLTLLDSWQPGENSVPRSKFSGINLEIGYQLNVGVINGSIGSATVTRLEPDAVILTGHLEASPPPPKPLTVCLAYSRPKMFRRTFLSIVELGVKDLRIFRSYKCEKSYEESSLYTGESLQALGLKALQQSCDTLVPEVQFHHLFKPFVQDVLKKEFNSSQIIVAHPNGKPHSNAIDTPQCLLIGPEGGFTENEIQLCINEGLRIQNFGSRHLRFETAVPFILGAMECFTSPSS